MHKSDATTHRIPMSIGSQECEAHKLHDDKRQIVGITDSQHKFLDAIAVSFTVAGKCFSYCCVFQQIAMRLSFSSRTMTTAIRNFIHSFLITVVHWFHTIVLVWHKQFSVVLCYATSSWVGLSRFNTIALFWSMFFESQTQT